MNLPSGHSNGSRSTRRQEPWSTTAGSCAVAEPFSDMMQHYCAVRSRTERLCEPLETEDFVIQSMSEASPAKWHLAHTTWFFETFVLAQHVANYEPHNPDFRYLFNSYYDTIGDRLARPSRGIISRPTVAEVFDYRQAIDKQMLQLLSPDSPLGEELARLVTVGLHHEQQHQELLLTDIKHAFSLNPIRPVYARERRTTRAQRQHDTTWRAYPAGVRWLGHDGDGFAFDNESPRHRVFVEAFEISSRLVTVGEHLEFIEAGGYRSPQYWLSDGWQACRDRRWEAPLYWERNDNRWSIFTLQGMRNLIPSEPVCHLSFYEADAHARWAGARLPTEAEWRTLADDSTLEGNFLESNHLHPVTAPSSFATQVMGDVWEWTASPYVPYPGYVPWAGALGEYNGKFMTNQMVLRGGSCVTPKSHVRKSYRNFFPPEARWQFSGLRLARSR